MMSTFEAMPVHSQFPGSTELTGVDQKNISHQQVVDADAALLAASDNANLHRVNIGRCCS
jgi:hypothetical protein